MRVLCVASCLLILATVLNIAEGFFWGKKKDNGELPIGFVKTTELLPPSQQPNEKVSGDTSKSMNLNGEPLKAGIKHDHPLFTPGKTNRPLNPPPLRAKPNTGLGVSSSSSSSEKKKLKMGNISNPAPGAKVPKKPRGSSSSSSSSSSDEKKKPKKSKLIPKWLRSKQSQEKKMMEKNNAEIYKNKKKSAQLEKQVDDLKKSLVSGNRDDSLEDLLEDFVHLTKKRVRVKFALVVYAIVNFILFITQNVGSFVYPPIGKAVYLVDLVTKNFVRGPLDEYFAEFQRYNDEVVSTVRARHPERYKDLKKGKRIKVTLSKGEFDMRVLKDRLDQDLPDKDLHVVDLNPFRMFRTVYNLKR